MRKILFLTVLSLILIMPALSQAAPAGNPADPVLLVGTYPIKGEAIADIVFERELDQGSEIEAQWYLAKVGVTLIEKIDVYGLLGTANLEPKKLTSSVYDIESEYGVAWGLGAKVLLYETEEYGDGILRVSVDGNYRAYKPDIDTISGSTSSSGEVDFAEWGASLGLSYTLDKITPYVGVKYSDVDLEISGTNIGTLDTLSINSDNVVGVFVGADYLFAENIALNLEGRFIDETAVNVGLKINF